MIYIVRTRHTYGSYVDFFRLAELSGYPIIYVDEVCNHDAPDSVFIISPINGEWNTWPKGYVKGRLILYQLEWNVDGEHNTPACVDEVWNGDSHHAKQNGFKYVPLGGHSGLNEVGSQYPAEKVYDISQFSYQTGRRQVITQQLVGNGLKLSPNEGLWGRARSVALLQSRLCLHVHQLDNMPTIAPLRWCLAAAHNLPMVSESIADRGIFTPTYMMQADYNRLASFAKYLLDPANHYEDELTDKAMNLHNLLCKEWTFKRMIEANV